MFFAVKEGIQIFKTCIVKVPLVFWKWKLCRACDACKRSCRFFGIELLLVGFRKWQKCAKSLHPTDLEVWDGPVLLLQSRVLTQQLVQELVPSPHLQHTNNCSECAMSVSVPNICENPYQISHRMPKQMLCFICLSFVVTYSCTAIIQYNKILNIFYNWFP